MPRRKYDYELPVHRVTNKRVAVADLEVDPNAQRQLNKRRARLMSEGFIPEAAGTIVVAIRPEDGALLVVDGYHRTVAADLAGEKYLDAEVHHDLDAKGRATLFLFKNREQVSPTAAEEYRIGLEAGLPLFVDTQVVLDKHSLNMGATSTNSIGAVNGVVNIVEKYGPETLERVLTVAEGAFGRQSKTWEGMILSGLGKVIGEYPAINDDELVTKMGRYGAPMKWIQAINLRATVNNTQGSGTGGRTNAAFSIIIEVYNARRRTTKLVPV